MNHFVFKLPPILMVEGIPMLLLFSLTNSDFRPLFQIHDYFFLLQIYISFQIIQGNTPRYIIFTFMSFKILVALTFLNKIEA